MMLSKQSPSVMTGELKPPEEILRNQESKLCDRRVAGRFQPVPHGGKFGEYALYQRPKLIGLKSNRQPLSHWKVEFFGM